MAPPSAGLFMCALPGRGGPGGASAFDHPHLFFVVMVSGSGRDVGQLVDLLGGELDSVGSCVLLDAGNPLSSGDRGDVVALGQDPGQSYLGRGGTAVA